MFLAAISACGGKEDSSGTSGGEGGQDVEKPLDYTITAQSGWTIYKAGTYRYGPSIIINEDGSIDAWFAATGSTFVQDLGESLYIDSSTTPFNLSGANSAGQMFTADRDFYSVAFCCPTWSTNGTEHATATLYKWDTDYATTVASDPVRSLSFLNMKDNDWDEIRSGDGSRFPAGTYLAVLSGGSEKAGVWIAEKAAAIQGKPSAAFQNGNRVSGALMAVVNYDSKETVSGIYWDQVSYQHSSDGGKTWTEEEMVLKPTKGSRDELSCCDPGVVKAGEYYYLGYTSTENAAGVDNHLYMARSKFPRGPWEKWNGSGWGGDKVEPVVTYTGSNTNWGAGEPSMVVLDGTLYLYYSWNDNGTTTRVATAPADDPMWPQKLSLKGTAINKSDITAADHCDVKYCDALKKFIAIHTASRMTSSSYIQVWVSGDGINFTKHSRLAGSLGAGLHNIGISGDPKGHIDVEKQQYIGYAYGLDSQGNSTWGQWNTMWNPLKFTKK